MKEQFNIIITSTDNDKFTWGGFVDVDIGKDLHEAVQIYMKDYYKKNIRSVRDYKL
jgi:hypothetical protein